MPFPLSLSGRAVCDVELGVPDALDRIEASLREQRAREISREGTDGLVFAGSFLSRRWGGSVLTVISRGRLRIARSASLLQVDYSLEFLQNVLVRGAVTAVAFLFIYLGVPTARTLTTFVAGLGFWFLLAALDYLVAASIFPRFLESELRGGSRGNDIN